MSLYFPTPEELGRHTIFPGVTLQSCAAEKMPKYSIARNVTGHTDNASTTMIVSL